MAGPKLPNRVRGIRQPIPSGYVLGNNSGGQGNRPPNLIKIADLSRATASSGAAIATGGVASLPTVADKNIVSNLSGGTLAPVGHTLTAILDNIVGNTSGDMLRRDGSAWTRLAIGSSNQVLTATGPTWTGLSALLDAVFSNTQGSVLYRGASAWAALGPGTSGQFLKTQGAAANPAWATLPVDKGLWAPVLSTVPTMANTGFTTQVNAGSATFSDRATGISISAPAGVGDNWRCLTQTAPGTPYTRKALLVISGRPVNYHLAAIGWYDGTKLHLLDLNYNNAWTMGVSKWTSVSAYSGSNDVNSESLLSVPVWVQIGDDGTNVSFGFSYSGDDNDFINMFTVAKASGYLGGSGYTNLVFCAQHNGTSPASPSIGTLMSWT